MKPPARVSTCLWFPDRARAAAEFYCTLLPDSRIEHIRNAPSGVLAIEFTLAGVPYTALNGGPQFTLNEAVSIVVTAEDQAETDWLWITLIRDGGAGGQCGWLRDRFGLSWQIVPKGTVELLTGPRAANVWPLFMKMGRIRLAELKAAAGE